MTTFSLSGCFKNEVRDQDDLFAYLDRDSDLMISLSWSASGASSFLSSTYFVEVKRLLSKVSADRSPSFDSFKLLDELAAPKEVALGARFLVNSSQFTVIADMYSAAIAAESFSTLRRHSLEIGKVITDEPEYLAIDLNSAPRVSLEIKTSGSLVFSQLKVWAQADRGISTSRFSPEKRLLKESLTNTKLYAQCATSLKREHDQNFGWFCLDSSKFTNLLSLMASKPTSDLLDNDPSVVHVGSVELNSSARLRIISPSKNIEPRGNQSNLNQNLPSRSAATLVVDGTIVDEIILGIVDVIGDTSAFSPLIKHFNNIDSLGIGVAAPAPGSLTPQIFLAVSSNDGIDLIRAIKREAETRLSEYGILNIGWQDIKIAEKSVSYLELPMSSGLYLHFENKTISLSSSESAMREMLASTNQSSHELHGSYTTAHLRFRELAELMDSFQGIATIISGKSPSFLEATGNHFLDSFKNLGTITAKQRISRESSTQITEIELNPPT